MTTDTEAEINAATRGLAGLTICKNVHGLSLSDGTTDPARWWPTVRCDDEDALALAYDSGAGHWI